MAWIPKGWHRSESAQQRQQREAHAARQASEAFRLVKVKTQPAKATVKRNAAAPLGPSVVSAALNQSALNDQAQRLLLDSLGRVLVNEYGRNVRAAVEANPGSDSKQLAQGLLSKPNQQAAEQRSNDERGRAMLAQYRDSVAHTRAQAGVARHQAASVLSTVGDVGITAQQRTTAEDTLASVNQLPILSPSQITSTRVTSQGAFLNQAILTRALLIASNKATALHTDAARTEEAGLEHRSTEERFQDTVAEMDREASRIAVTANEQLMTRSVKFDTGRSLSRQLPVV